MIQALKRARKAGLRIVVVSGRTLAHLERQLPGVADAIVAENGCIVRVGASAPVKVAELPECERATAIGLGRDVEEGEALVSVALEGSARLREALENQPVSLLPNKDRLMVVPTGVDKASGLAHALRELHIDPSRTIAFGDAENDMPMLRMAGLGVAVANAVDELKRAADVVTEEPHGRGVVRFLERNVLAREEATR